MRRRRRQAASATAIRRSSAASGATEARAGTARSSARPRRVASVRRHAAGTRAAREQRDDGHGHHRHHHHARLQAAREQRVERPARTRRRRRRQVITGTTPRWSTIQKPSDGKPVARKQGAAARAPHGRHRFERDPHRRQRPGGHEPATAPVSTNQQASGTLDAGRMPRARRAMPATTARPPHEHGAGCHDQPRKARQSRRQPRRGPPAAAPAPRRGRATSCGTSGSTAIGHCGRSAPVRHGVSHVALPARSST